MNYIIAIAPVRLDGWTLHTMPNNVSDPLSPATELRVSALPNGYQPYQPAPSARVVLGDPPSLEWKKLDLDERWKARELDEPTKARFTAAWVKAYMDVCDEVLEKHIAAIKRGGPLAIKRAVRSLSDALSAKGSEGPRRTLSVAREMLARPGAFARHGELAGVCGYEHARAFTAAGADCSATDPYAVRWDLVGAIRAADQAVNGPNSGLPDEALRAIGRVVLGELPEDYSTMVHAIDAWAAQHDQHETSAALDRAIYDAS